jgi:hypothetical protein
MSSKDQTQASKEDDTTTSTLGEALPEHVNDVELGAEDQKGKPFSSTCPLSPFPVSSTSALHILCHALLLTLS